MRTRSRGPMAARRGGVDAREPRVQRLDAERRRLVAVARADHRVGGGAAKKPVVSARK